MITKYYILSIATALIFLCFLSSCVEVEEDLGSQNCTENCTVIKGRVTTGDGTEPLSGANIKIRWSNVHPPYGGGIIRTKAKSKTDADGDYHIEFKSRADELLGGHYQLILYVGNEYYKPVEGDSYSFCFSCDEEGETKIYNIYAPYKATLVVSAEGIANFSELDRLGFSSTFKYGIDGSEKTGHVRAWYKDSYDKVYRIHIAAQQLVPVQNTLRRNGVLTYSYDTLYCEKGKEYEYVVKID
jgi:hypothetical protein